MPGRCSIATAICCCASPGCSSSFPPTRWCCSCRRPPRPIAVSRTARRRPKRGWPRCRTGSAITGSGAASRICAAISDLQSSSRYISTPIGPRLAARCGGWRRSFRGSCWRCWSSRSRPGRGCICC
ncbi:hypothetical protein EAH84_00900 [Sphingomonas oligophenolica]|uniref:Uncharacterized protein n=1 Tax=Sphingomonas oligophenolica TaxID=301154 RepID=A0A502CTG8_9SPHN|nr:hypothetical protein EAH84_00900 [Sphingomonas oligophenolica]